MQKCDGDDFMETFCVVFFGKVLKIKMQELITPSSNKMIGKGAGESSFNSQSTHHQLGANKIQKATTKNKINRN